MASIWYIQPVIDCPCGSVHEDVMVFWHKGGGEFLGQYTCPRNHIKRLVRRDYRLLERFECLRIYFTHVGSLAPEWISQHVVQMMSVAEDIRDMLNTDEEVEFLARCIGLIMRDIEALSQPDPKALTG